MVKQLLKCLKKVKNKLKFQNFHKQLQVPFVIYADFKAITERVQSCQPNKTQSYTESYQKHTDCSYGYMFVCCYDNQYTMPITIYRGEKAVYKFSLNSWRRC